MVTKQKSQKLIGKILYGSIFVIFLPFLLIFWSSILDRSINWPVPHLPLIAFGSFLLGSFLVFKGIFDLVIFGQGLPMNPYPPKKFVTKDVYSWFPHPIYTGAILLLFGISLGIGSSGGLYLVTPVFILAIISFVYGYEKRATEKLFGNVINQYQPTFSLPTPSEKKVLWSKKIAMCIRIFLPWIIIGYLIDYIHYSTNSNGVFMNLVNILPWPDLLNLVLLIPYIYLVLKLLNAETERELRKITIASSIATLIGIYFYILLPAFKINLSNDKEKLALINIVVVLFAYNYQFIWNQLRSLSEWIANSRHDWLFFNGNFRIINHGIYSGLGGAIGIGIVSYIIGNNLAAIILTICVIAGAAVFAQFWWGSNALLRPFGYWGAILGSVIGILFVYFFLNIPLSKIILACVLCAPFAQATGRFRCLTQGCCHGVVTDNSLGIRVWHSQSRVVLLSGLKGKYLINTQLYSILFNLLLGLLLWGLWLSLHFNSSVIIGMYLILTGVERFTEDAYRGEKQTRMLWGLPENQWIAVGSLMIGICITIIPTSLPSNGTGLFNLPFLVTILTGGLLTAFVMSVDFPKSCLRFSRLSG